MPAPAIALDDAAPAADWTDAARRAAAAERAAFREVFAPRVRMNLLEWAEQRRMLSPEANALAAEAGGPVRYSADLTPYHREVMLALSDPRTEIVACKFPSQDGKTEILNNFVGWRIDTEPGPMLVLQPTKELGESWSKDRLAPMLRDTPALRGKVRDARSRDADNTILHKKFPGGHLTAVGSNSAAGLSARPIRDVAVDEVDRCAKSAGTEGDSIRLAFRRTTTFRRGKKLLISSPTIKGDSRIDDEYRLGTQEEFHVPCPHCQTYHYLKFGGRDTAYGIKWALDDAGQVARVWYVCEPCGAEVEEHHKAWMIAHHRWAAQNPGAGPRRRSFWKNAYTSNLVAWRKLVAEWLEVQGKHEQLQQYVNTVLCELWNPVVSEELTATAILDHVEPFPRASDAEDAEVLVPDGAALLTRAADVQGDRIETAVWAWGAGERAWLVDWRLVPGDPGIPYGSAGSPWNELHAEIGRTYRHQYGAEMRPAVTFVDSGGHHAKEVYAFTKARNHLGVYAIKGANTEGHPILGRPTRNNSAKAILYMVGSFTGKEALMTRLARVKAPGPGYIALPDWLDAEQLEQFMNERLATRRVGGVLKRLWEKTGRNEQVDLYVYALAALQKLGQACIRSLGERAERLTAEGRATSADGRAPAAEHAYDPAPAARPAAPPPRPRSGWVNWKR